MQTFVLTSQFVMFHQFCNSILTSTHHKKVGPRCLLHGGTKLLRETRRLLGSSHIYSCGLPTATIEYSPLPGCVCVRVCVCVCVCVCVN